jgi:hypothetical protein
MIAALQKIASLFMVLLAAPAALGQVTSLRRTTSDETTTSSIQHNDYAINPGTQAAMKMIVAKMAMTNTISHYLQTGEWMQVGCPQTLSPSDYVACFKPEMMGVDGKDLQFTTVLHPNPLLNGKTVKYGDHEDFDIVYHSLNACSCDHNSFWNLSTYPWSESDLEGDSIIKTALSTKVFSSERGGGQNYDSCAAAPEDEVFYCIYGVWPWWEAN